MFKTFYQTCQGQIIDLKCAMPVIIEVSAIPSSSADNVKPLLQVPYAVAGLRRSRRYLFSMQHVRLLKEQHPNHCQWERNVVTISGRKCWRRYQRSLCRPLRTFTIPSPKISISGSSPNPLPPFSAGALGVPFLPFLVRRHPTISATATLLVATIGAPLIRMQAQPGPLFLYEPTL